MPAIHTRALAVLGAGLAVAAATLAWPLLAGGGRIPLLRDGGGRAPSPAAGSAGLVPGGPALAVDFLVSNQIPGPGPLTVTAITPDPATLPLECPPDAWSVTLATSARIARGAALPVRIRADIALTDDAPSGCQGVTVDALVGAITARDHAGRQVALSSVADRPLQVAVLGTPGVAVREDAGQTLVVTGPDRADPPGTHYTVERQGGDGDWEPVCQLTRPVPCAAGRSGTRAHYRTTARLGSFWHRTSAPTP